MLDRVLIQRAKVVEKTASGLYLPSAATHGPPPEGTVLAVGPGAPGKDGQVKPVSVKEGDRVVLPAFGGVPIKVGEEASRPGGGRGVSQENPLELTPLLPMEQEYQLYRDSEILAILRE